MNTTTKYDMFDLIVVTLIIPVFLDVTLCRLAGSFWCSEGLFYL